MRRRRCADSSSRISSKTAVEAGKVLSKTFGEVGVDALVFLFERDGEGENFTFGEAFKAAHSGPRLVLRIGNTLHGFWSVV